jgi:eukaryotic-like serine/threonine-protein kinase
VTVDKKPRQIYEFGVFRVDSGERLLLRDGAPVTLPQKDGTRTMLTPKVVETLLALVERAGQIVNKDELMSAVWPDTAVEEGNLSANISLLRKALGTSEDGRPYIETFPKRGYRFNGPVRKPSEELAPVDTEAELVISKRTRTHIIKRVETEDEDHDNRAPAVAALAANALDVTQPRLEVMQPADAGPRKLPRILLISVALLLLSAVLIAVLFWVRRFNQTRHRALPFASMKVSRLTTNGTSGQAALSPDGQYLVHVTGGAGQQSLQLRNLAGGSDQEIVPPGKENVSAVNFSPDGKYVYFIKYSEKEGGVLSQVPLFGGTSRVLAKDVDGCATFSPDGKQFAFVRGLPVETEDALMLGNVEGGGERKLASHKMREIFPDAAIRAWGPAWSPDGKLIAFPLSTIDAQGNQYKTVELARVSDGAETALTSEKWFSIGQVAWLPDGSGLIIAAAGQEQDAPHQLWLVDYPQGSARRITNDLSNYDGVSVNADASALVTVQSEWRASIWVGSGGDESHLVQLSSDKNDGIAGLAWTPDGRIVYTSTANGNAEIWIMDADGKNRKQLTFSDGQDYRPALSFDGRYIVFVSDRTGAANLWRMDVDGRNLRQLTNQRADYYPSCAPDNRWVFYSSDGSGRRQLWRVPLDGGLAEEVTNYAANLPVISPDGKYIACSYVDDRESPRRYTTALVPISGGRPVTKFEFPRSFAQVIHWTPDSRFLSYLVTSAGVSNIWRQPLDGSQPLATTDFKSNLIFRYELSRDGKVLALARGSVTSDVVLIKDLRMSR